MKITNDRLFRDGEYVGHLFAMALKSARVRKQRSKAAQIEAEAEALIESEGGAE